VPNRPLPGPTLRGGRGRSEAMIECIGGAMFLQLSIRHPNDERTFPCSSSRRAWQAASSAASTASSGCASTADRTERDTRRLTTAAASSAWRAGSDSAATRWRMACIRSQGTASAVPPTTALVRRPRAQLTRRKGTPPRPLQHPLPQQRSEPCDVFQETIEQLPRLPGARGGQREVYDQPGVRQVGQRGGEGIPRPHLRVAVRADHA
jgi:hypothetical protein